MDFSTFSGFFAGFGEALGLVFMPFGKLIKRFLERLNDPEATEAWLRSHDPPDFP